MRTEEAGIAGCGVQRHDAISLAERRYAGPNLLDHSCKFVAEGNWRFQHSGMIAAPVYLQVGAAGKRRPYTDQQLPGFRPRNGHPLQPQVFLAVEHRCCHFGDHPFYFLIFNPCIRIPAGTSPIAAGR